MYYLSCKYLSYLPTYQSSYIPITYQSLFIIIYPCNHLSIQSSIYPSISIDLAIVYLSLYSFPLVSNLLMRKSGGLFLFFGFFFFIFRATPAAYGGSQARAASVRSELHLWPTPQPTAMPDPEPTERGQGSNPSPQGCLVRFLNRWATMGTLMTFFCLHPWHIQDSRPGITPGPQQ